MRANGAGADTKIARDPRRGESHPWSDFAMMTSFPPLVAAAPQEDPVPTGPSPARKKAAAMPIRILIALTLASGLALAAEAHAAEAGISAQSGAEHTVELDPGGRHWRLLPLLGSPLEITLGEHCPLADTPLPPGLWLLTRDADDQPVLLAPSATTLPAGHSGVVALHDCDAAPDGRGHRLAVPAALSELLSSHGGTVLVQ